MFIKLAKYTLILSFLFSLNTGLINAQLKNFGTDEFATSIVNRGDTLVEPEYTGLGEILATILNLVFFITLATCLIFFIVCGIKYFTSVGDERKLEEAKGCIQNALIGSVIIVGFRVVISLIITSFTGPGTSLL